MQSTYEIEVYFAPFGYVIVEYTKDICEPDFPDEGIPTVVRDITKVSISGDDIRDMLNLKALDEISKLFDAEIGAEGDE